PSSRHAESAPAPRPATGSSRVSIAPVSLAPAGGWSGDRTGADRGGRAGLVRAGRGAGAGGGRLGGRCRLARPLAHRRLPGRRAPPPGGPARVRSRLVRRV